MIGRITVSGHIHQFKVPFSIAGSSSSIAAGPDGALWFTAEGYSYGTIGRLTTNGNFTSYQLPYYNDHPEAITAGSDGALWFTLNGSIGRITTDGVVTAYPLPVNQILSSIVAGLDGALWFTSSWDLDRVGRITTPGTATPKVEEWLTPSYGPIVVGPDGALWVAGFHCGSPLLRVTTHGQLTEYTPPPAVPCLNGIAAGYGRTLWFTSGDGPTNLIGNINTSGDESVDTVGTKVWNPSGLILGPDGALWGPDPYLNKIDRVQP